MSKKQDFVKFYMEHKDKKGCVNFFDIKDSFNLRKGYATPFVFNDANGLKLVKFVWSREEMSAEMLLSRLYNKLGFKGAAYYPCRKTNNFAEYAISQSLIDDNSGMAKNFVNKIFEFSANVFPKQIGENESLKLTGYYTEDAARELLLLRLLDTASLNTDRHLNNFVIETKTEDNAKIVASHIRPFDYANSASVEFNSKHGRYYNNFITYGGEYASRDYNLTREEMIEHFKHNESVQAFLPRSESSEILGSVDFQKEAQELKNETGYQVDQKLLDIWAKSYDDMAEELEQ